MTRSCGIALLLAAAVASGASAASEKQPPRAWLGFGYTVHNFQPEAKVRQWLYVQRVEPNSPAFAAGLRVQDAIVAIDDKPVQFVSASAALDYFRGITAGAVLKLRVLRGGKAFTLTLRAAELPSMYLSAWKKNDAHAKQDDDAKKSQ